MKKDYERPEVEMKSLVSEEIMKGTGVEFDPEAPESQIMPIFEPFPDINNSIEEIPDIPDLGGDGGDGDDNIDVG